jgi:hypothetical protein
MAAVMEDDSAADAGFLVHVIESPAEEERRVGTSEGEPIRQVLALSGVPVTAALVATADEFEHQIRVVFPALARSAFPDRVAVLHLSTHGTRDGLQIGPTVVPWVILCRWLAEANWEAFNSMTLCMSACSGLQAFQGALGRHRDRMPFFSIIGSTGQPTWGQSAAAFVALYTQFSQQSSIRTAVEAMRWASRHFEWNFVLADELVVLGNPPDLTLEEILEQRRHRVDALDQGPLHPA